MDTFEARCLRILLMLDACNKSLNAVKPSQQRLHFGAHLCQLVNHFRVSNQ